MKSPLFSAVFMACIAIALCFLTPLAGCATTEQKQPTAQTQPTSADQKGEQWADVGIVQTNNVYPSGAAPSSPATAGTNEDGQRVVNEASVTHTLPDGTKVESVTGTYASGAVTQTITVTTHGQASKADTQTGASASSNTTSTATPTNSPTTDVTLPLPGVP